MPAAAATTEPAIRGPNPVSAWRGKLGAALASISRSNSALLFLALFFLIPPSVAGVWRVAAFYAEAPAILLHPFDLGYPESAVVHGAARLLTEEPWAYPPPGMTAVAATPLTYATPAHVVYPYGPLTYLLPATIVKAGEGDPPLVRAAGRAVAWSSLAAVAAILAALGWNARPRSWSAPSQIALGAALGLFAATAFLDPVVRLSPRNILAFRGDAPALLLTLAGALALRRAIAPGPAWGRFAEPRPTLDRDLAAMALVLLSLAAGFHPLAGAGLVAGAVALLAAGFWRASVVWCVGAAGFATAGLAAGRLLFGEHFLAHLFSMSGCPWDPTLPFRYLWRAPHVPAMALLVLAALARQGGGDPRARAALGFLATLAFLQGAALAKAGSSYNYLIPTATLALAFGVELLGRAAESLRPRALALPFSFLLAAAWLPQVPKGRLAEPFPLRADRLAKEARQLDDLAQFVAEFRRMGRHVVVDDASVDLYLGHQPSMTDPYLLALEVAEGRVSPREHPFYAWAGNYVATRWFDATGEAVDAQGRRYEFIPPFAARHIADHGEVVAEAPSWRLYRIHPPDYFFPPTY